MSLLRAGVRNGVAITIRGLQLPGSKVGLGLEAVSLYAWDAVASRMLGFFEKS